MLLRLTHPAANIRALREAISVMIRYRGLLIEMTKRELSEQYAGQIFGKLWAIAHPLLLMALFVFLFNFVFKARIDSSLNVPLDYTTYILAGLLPWLGFQAAMSRSCTAFTSKASLVKQVVFPIEILPARIVFASLFGQIVSLVALLLYVLAVHGLPPATYLLLPVLFLLQIIAMLGAAFALASVGVFIRDLKDIVQIFTAWGIYLAPVVFLPEWVPGILRPILYVNPISYMVWCYQDALFYGRFEHPWAWGVFGAGSVLALVGGYRLFRRTRGEFGNLL